MLERLRDRVEQLLRDAAQHRRIVEILDDDHELVAAQAREQIGLAQRGRERARDALQELVADPVAERVVDVLEPVEVDEQHADAAPAALRLRDRLRQTLVQQQTVRQPGQRVARGHVLQPLLRLNPRRHVLHERQDRRDLAVGDRAAPSDTTRTRSCRRPCDCCGSGRWRAAPHRSSASAGARRPPRGRPRGRAGCHRSACRALRRRASRRCSPPAATSVRAGNRWSHSSTASGVLLMCEDSIQLARRSASSLRFWSWMSVCTA